MTTLSEAEWIRCTRVRREINRLVCEQGFTEVQAVEYVREHGTKE